MATEEASWPENGAEAGAAYEYSEENNDNTANDSNASGDVPDNESEDGGDYDPESVGISADTPALEQTDSEQPPAAAKPKMTGGFLVEASDDDEDDEDVEVPKPLATEVPDQPEPETAEEGNSSGNEDAAVNSAKNESDAPPSGVNNVLFYEARIKEDPRGDMDAWLALMAVYKYSGQLDELRKVYGRFLEVFPQAADIWCDWIEAELAQDNFVDAEQLFGRCLMSVANVRLWTVYLNYIRRRNDLNNDASGQARRTITQSYEFIIDNIGVDRDSGDIWQDYVQFIKNGPGQIGGTGWQDQQKMDQLRKVYQRAINVPMSAVNNLWKEYDQFEMGLNKVTGRKFIQERSPGYMSAKSGNIALDNITRDLKRTNLPRLPPAPGFDGDDEFKEQIDLWKKWISWEKEDPLVLQEDELKAYQQRIIYCYKQALMALRFWPEIWMDAAEWCFANDIRENDKELGTELLTQGIAANPESVLLALKHADRIEATYPGKEGDKAEFAKAVREPHDTILDTLYAMGDKGKEREKMEIAAIKQQEQMLQQSIEGDEDDADQTKSSVTHERVHAIQQAYAAENTILSKTISYVWIALARAMRRIQGKGNQTEGGLRKVFTDARHRGRLSSDVYVAVALLESIVYKDPVGSKIFERGARLFPNDEYFMIEYLKYLHAKDDTTNARVVFETCVNRLVTKPETIHKAKPLYAYFHKYESQYGELSQIAKLEERMIELFPEDPKLRIFVSRYSSDQFDPISKPLIISKAVQMRPRLAIPKIEQQPVSAQNSPQPVRQEQSPRPQYVRATASPKRPFGADDEELNPPKRVARGISPLKGAAGRRLDQQRRNQASALHRDITFLLGILPASSTYDAQRLNASGMANLLRDTQLPDYSTWRSRTGGQYVQLAQTIAQSHGRQTSRDYNRAASPYGHGGPSPGWSNQAGYGQQGSQYGGYRYQ